MGVAMANFGNESAGSAPPRVLLIYYSYTGQVQRVLQAAGAALHERGCTAVDARLEFTDPRYADRFSSFPMKRVWPDMVSVLPAQLRHATGEIRIPDAVVDSAYDLVCIGSPTWWRTTCMPVRSFLHSEAARELLCDTPFAAFVVCRRYWRENAATVRDLGEKCGGRYAGGLHFVYPGNQLTSLLSLTSYLGSGQYRDRYLGVRIPPTNISAPQLDQARSFAVSLAESLFGDRLSASGATVEPGSVDDLGVSNADSGQSHPPHS